MKKQLLLFSLLFTMLLSYSQEVTEPSVAADTTNVPHKGRAVEPKLQSQQKQGYLVDMT